MANYFEQPNIEKVPIHKNERPKDIDDIKVYKELKKKVDEARELSKVIKNGVTTLRKLGNTGEVYELTFDESNCLTEIKEEDERGNTINFFGDLNEHPNNEYSKMEAVKEQAAQKFINKNSN